MRRFRFVSCLGVAVCLGLAGALARPVRAERVAAGRNSPAAAVPDVVGAVNSLVQADIGVAAALGTRCVLERLPGSRTELLPLVPGGHRRLIEDAARGRMRIARRTRSFDLLGAIDEPSEQPAAAAAVRAYFTQRAVDVAIGTGLTDGPYPVSFDWVVVLDPGSQTLMSFVLNCRD